LYNLKINKIITYGLLESFLLLTFGLYTENGKMEILIFVGVRKKCIEVQEEISNLRQADFGPPPILVRKWWVFSSMHGSLLNLLWSSNSSLMKSYKMLSFITFQKGVG